MAHNTLYYTQLENIGTRTARHCTESIVKTRFQIGPYSGSPSVVLQLLLLHILLHVVDHFLISSISYYDSTETQNCGLKKSRSPCLDSTLETACIAALRRPFAIFWCPWNFPCWSAVWTWLRRRNRTFRVFSLQICVPRVLTFEFSLQDNHSSEMRWYRGHAPHFIPLLTSPGLSRLLAPFNG